MSTSIASQIKYILVVLIIKNVCLNFIYYFIEQIHTPCSGKPCENGATCVEMDYGDYKCQCPQNFGGIHCEGELRMVCLCTQCEICTSECLP